MFDLDFNDFINIPCNAASGNCTFLVDTQADISIFKENSIYNNINVNSLRTINIKGITSDTISTIGTALIELNIGDRIIGHEFHIVPDTFNINTDGIIGKDFLLMYQCSINYSDMTFSINTSDCHTILKISEGPDDESLIVPARSEVIRKFAINASEDCLIDNQEVAPGVFLARTIVNPKEAFIRVLNLNEEPQRINKNIHGFEPLSLFDCYIANEIPKTNSREERLEEKIGNAIPEQHRHKLMPILKMYSDIFALPEDRMTVNNFYQQKLRISDTNPIYIKNYRTPHSQKSEIKSQVDRLIKNDLIEPSVSNFNSPIILVPKKSTNGTPKWRMCIDYRGVNRKLIADKFPLPRIDEVLDGLGRAKYFSVIDLYNGFHQVPLEESSRDITAFSTEQGSFRWKVLPFGLNVSPNSFSRMMQIAFSGLCASRLFLYMDDIIVPGKSEKEHIENLEETFKICRLRNLKINPDKCQFFRTEVLYLGHICTANGIRPDPSKFKTIKDYPRPHDSDAVRRFVAMANYYRKFIPEFSITSIPLNSLTRKNTPFEWNSDCENAFVKLKNQLASPTTLAFPDFTQEFTLTVDASLLGCGAVLSQEGRPIAFASKSFSRADRNKSTIEQELIAVHWSIGHFRPYLYGKHFIVLSDHKPLVHLYSLKETTPKLTRLRLDLAEYNFSIEHIPGKTNVVADALSRIHIEDIKAIGDKKRDYELEQSIKITTRSMTNKKINQNTSTNEQNLERTIREPNIMHATTNMNMKGIPILHTNVVENALGLTLTSSVHHKFMSQRYIFAFDTPIIQDIQFPQLFLSQLGKLAGERNIKQIKMFTNEDIFRICAINTLKTLGNQILQDLQLILLEPIEKINEISERKRLIALYHDDPIFGGHPGTKRLLAKLKRHYTWKGMFNDVKQHVTSCRECQLSKPNAKIIEPMVITETPQKPFDIVIVDTIGPMARSANGNTYAITMMCDLTKYLVTAPIPNKEAKTVAKAIFEKVVLIYGPMKTLLSDQGSEFVNSVMRELCDMLKIKQKTSTAYHHQTVGSVERNHRVFNEYFRTYIKSLAEWEEYLAYFNFCYNTSYHSSLDHKYTPFELVFARELNIPNIILNNGVDPLYNIDDYAKEAKYRLQVTNAMAKELLEKSKCRAKRAYDTKINPLELKINDRVKLINENRHKHDHMYKGPFIVIGIESPNVTIIDPTTNKTKITHKNNVRKYT